MSIVVLPHQQPIARSSDRCLNAAGKFGSEGTCDCRPLAKLQVWPARRIAQVHSRPLQNGNEIIAAAVHSRGPAAYMETGNLSQEQ
jgi:hypothetical protein